jgi:4-carboxymuconolactone decarboxylase
LILGYSQLALAAENKRPASMKPDEQALYEFTKELLDTKHVSDATFQNAVKAFGEKGVVDLVALTGYYGMVSALLNVDRYPLPAGAKPELAALR